MRKARLLRVGSTPIQRSFAWKGSRARSALTLLQVPRSQESPTEVWPIDRAKNALSEQRPIGPPDFARRLDRYGQRFA